MSREYTEDEKKHMYAGVLRFMELHDKSKILSDEELVEQVIDKVWGRAHNLGSWEEQLLDELISRFELHAGINRDEEGRIIKPQGIALDDKDGGPTS